MELSPRVTILENNRGIISLDCIRRVSSHYEGPCVGEKEEYEL